MKVRAGDTIAVWFSCGVASAIAAKKLLKNMVICVTFVF